MGKIIQNVFRFQTNHGIVKSGGTFDMKNIYLLKYSVKGIKTLDELVSLSFYKKIIPQKKFLHKLIGRRNYGNTINQYSFCLS